MSLETYQSVSQKMLQDPSFTDTNPPPPFLVEQRRWVQQLVKYGSTYNSVCQKCLASELQSWIPFYRIISKSNF